MKEEGAELPLEPSDSEAGDDEEEEEEQEDQEDEEATLGESRAKSTASHDASGTLAEAGSEDSDDFFDAVKEDSNVELAADEDTTTPAADGNASARREKKIRRKARRMLLK